MRFIGMHRTDSATEAGVLPSPELVMAMGKLTEEMAKAGVLRAGEGLHPSSKGVRLNFSGGKRSVTDGPFTESKGLIAGFVIIRVTSMDEAIEWATRFADVVGDVEIDIRPVVEFWDLGFGSKPEGLTTTRYMLAHKGDRNYEAGVLPAPELMTRMDSLMEEMTKAGVFLTAEGIKPSSKGVRLHYSRGKQTVTDGPFTEAKELIAGYAIFEVESLQEAVEWSWRFAEVMGEVEMDLRPLFEESDINPEIASELGETGQK